MKKFAILFASIVLATAQANAAHHKTRDTDQLESIVVTAKKIPYSLRRIDEFAAKMESQYAFNKDELKEKLIDVSPSQQVLAMFRPHRIKKDKETPEEIAFRFERYVNNGVKFWTEHQDVVERAEREYGVLPEIVIALVGI